MPVREPPGAPHTAPQTWQFVVVNGDPWGVDRQRFRQSDEWEFALQGDRTMTDANGNTARLVPWALAFATLIAFAPDLWAQSVAPPAGTTASEDMRLWSFGDCDRRFPYVNSAERKACVRVVGSPEATEARALRVCEVSHEKDREEIERCKAAYHVNKEQATRDGVVPNGLAVAQAAPSPEMMKRVKAISAAAVEKEREAALVAAGPQPDPEEPPAPQQEVSSPTTMIAIVLLGVILLGLGANVMRRKQTGSA
jgi:hypothetical protein